LANDIILIPGESTCERQEVGDTVGSKFAWKSLYRGSRGVNPSGLNMHTKISLWETKDVWGGENAGGWRFGRKVGWMVEYDRGYTKFHLQPLHSYS